MKSIRDDELETLLESSYDQEYKPDIDDYSDCHCSSSCECTHDDEEDKEWDSFRKRLAEAVLSHRCFGEREECTRCRTCILYHANACPTNISKNKGTK